MKSLVLEHRDITLGEYQKLRATVNWGDIEDASAQRALDNTQFSVCVTDNGEAVGIGRVVGDGAIYFYVQDVIVLAAYNKLGVGKMIMADILIWLEKNAPENAFIGLMAADGTSNFYEQFGFEQRPTNRPGMYKPVDKRTSSNK